MGITQYKEVFGLFLNHFKVCRGLFLHLSSALNMDGPIIIIGSGLSGFAAARRLMDNDITNIVILEAENRIGGRINSVPFSDGIIDLGAQWVHGQKNNIIYEMTRNMFNFGTTPFEELYSTFLLTNGTKPEQKDIRKIVDVAYKILDDIDDLDDPQGSIGDIFNKKFEKALKSSKLKNIEPKVIELMKDNIQRNYNGYMATNSWFDVSAKINSEEGKASGNQYLTWKKKGYKTFFDFLTKKAPNPAQYLNIESKVQLNKKVTNIKYNPKDETSNVAVTCSDGSTYSAKHVIFTPSLGVLKKYHESLFTPALPDQKILAIKNYGFGTVGKVFLEFDQPFWKEQGKPFLAYEFLWLDSDIKEAIATNREWMTNITGIYIVDQFPNLLEVFLGGSNLNEFETSSDSKIIDDCMWLLEKSLAKTLPKPKSMIRTKWLTNENFLGAYSYGSIDADKANVRPKDIAESIKNVDEAPILLFAGEATDDRYPSMAHGAVRSGFRAADEIVDFYD
ncbi:spermine oxidase-like isoform X2 [Chironomus tepperi]|uniref:spermine oxidase-like isoform X2 n=1 Tax=Chironomus tepperi TaxID=113505 RepID=UPI00391EE62F